MPYLQTGTYAERLTVERGEAYTDDYGDTAYTWERLGQIRGALIEHTQSEEEAGSGSRITETATFRIRANCIGREKFGVDDRLIWNGLAFDIRTLKSLGRRNGFEITAQHIYSEGTKRERP